MRERFVNIQKVLGEKFNAFLKTVLDAPPSYEEAYLNFKHSKRCSQAQDLVTFKVTKAVLPYDPSGLGFEKNVIDVDINYLECPECHSSVRYSS